MAELRRLLIDEQRLKRGIGLERIFTLSPKEVHYLKHVLRLHRGDVIAVVDGAGHSWEATVKGGGAIRLSSSLDFPISEQSRPNTLIGLAVVVPKRGFDEFLRMSCEIGVDIIQPLGSERSVVRTIGNGKKLRWESIIREAVEQSERLWTPELREIVNVKDWLRKKSSKSAFSFASTRLKCPIDFQSWLLGLNQDINQIWVAIGPEGGWTSTEESFAKEAGCIQVQLGDSIMRTSTAAVAATQLMVTSRPGKTRCVN